MQQKVTQVENRQKDFAFLKNEIMRVLGWDDLQYGYFQYEMGLEFLEHYIEDREHQLIRSRTFWNWWKNQWAIREESLLINKWDMLCTFHRIEVYKDVHSGVHLATSIYPTKSILERSYMEMIDEFTREELARNRSAGGRMT